MPHTWQLGKLCGRTCYVTKPVTEACICDVQFETTNLQMANLQRWFMHLDPIHINHHL